ncbi:MAG: type III-B CRISPR-associated protein Cas10/Cmr2 [Deltaproteobacteria bacterium]|nr:type III-B CRISPR-associated protein Cas10/Cmr2 [Deltaproteobacteria bacterium]
MKTDVWQLKLAARIHDPAEKALVLYRDPSGHEGGSIVGVGKALGLPTRPVVRRLGDDSTVEYEKLDLDEDTEQVIKQADHWASAADRPQFPRDASERYPSWAQVRFAQQGTLIHPLTGQDYPLGNVAEQVLVEDITEASEKNFKNLIHRKQDGSADHRLSLLAFWRFGPELGRKIEGLGQLWSLLPADTRIPDHTIWQHLDLTSALAGAMVDGNRPAILTVAIGPVQEFIAASRSTSDLWAGSHFIATLAWRAMNVVAEALGPDAILFPQLRGVPVVDLWLIEQGIRRELFDEYGAEWTERNTDYNPLFGAALPNKFVAIVRENEARQLAATIQQSVRDWVQAEAREMLNTVLEAIGEMPDEQHCYRQLERQLKGFPEVHWSVVPWLDETDTKTALTAFQPGGKEPEFFSTIWSKLKEPIEPEAGWKFWAPNDGALYPAIHDCAERVLAAAKSVRSFEQLEQKGYRDSLSGEYEWLTLAEQELVLPPGQRTKTLWARVAERKPSWAKKGEHLSAFGLIKRLWPTRYVDWLKGQGITSDVDRYVISTHVMALAPSLEKLTRDGPADEDSFRRLWAQTQGIKRAVLPRKLMRQEYRQHTEWWETAARLPSLLDELRDQAEDEQEEQVEQVRRTIEKAIGIPAENYYGLILFDGDNLGAWLSGDENPLKFCETFHKKVLDGMRRYDDIRLRDYLELKRPTSPARHMAISAALNGFSLDLVRHVVEDLCLGKLLYSGGDDVMAMVCVRDLPKAMWLLRLVYSGGMAGEAGGALFDHDLAIRRGFVMWRNRLYRVMGERATASLGAVIAHHTAPLGAVLRNLREAELDAKNKGGRNAFSLRVLKRSGGRQDLTLPWSLGPEEKDVSTMHTLEALRKAIEGDVSRRAAYQVEEWMRGFPLLDDETQLRTLIAENVAYQFNRKAHGNAKLSSENAERVARIAVLEAQRRLRSNENTEPGDLAREAYKVVRGLLSTAEFLAREARGSKTLAAAVSAKEARHG